MNEFFPQITLSIQNENISVLFKNQIGNKLFLNCKGCHTILIYSCTEKKESMIVRFSQLESAIVFFVFKYLRVLRSKLSTYSIKKAGVTPLMFRRAGSLYVSIFSRNLYYFIDILIFLVQCFLIHA